MIHAVGYRATRPSIVEKTLRPGFAPSNRVARRKRSVRAFLSRILHRTESIPGHRFKTLVGRNKAIARFSDHARSTLPALYRTNGCQSEYGTVLCRIDRVESLRRDLPNSAMGTHRDQRTDDGPSLPGGTGSRRAFSRTCETKTPSRVSNNWVSLTAMFTASAQYSNHPEKHASVIGSHPRANVVGSRLSDIVGMRFMRALTAPDRALT